MIVYLDGENVVHQIKDTLIKAHRISARDEIVGLDLAGLIYKLVGRRDITIKYYTTTLKLIQNDEELEKKSQEMITWSARWISSLQQQGIQIVKAGKLKVREGVVCRNCGHQEMIFREKGVDVQLAVDMLLDSETDNQLVVWSSDADLLPALQAAKDRGARVKNLAHADSLNRAVTRVCGEWQTLSTKQLVTAFEAISSGNDKDDKKAHHGN